jgi:hypothetical protein
MCSIILIAIQRN